MARYELLERIGMGGMAEIYRGKAIAGGGFEKPVAIKRILPHLSQDKRFVELLITEAKTLSSLRHRNIVQIYDVGLGDDGQYFLVMEYVDGTDLGALYESCEKRKRRLPIGVALHVCGEVCEALDHAHRARGPGGEPLGLVHRDVSPSNVLLSRSGEVKLTDFGIAKRTEEVTGHGGVRGKFAYISPEQAHNTHVDGRSDVYSVGIMLYELITGARLFSDLPDFDALRAVREGRTRRPRDVDPGIDPELDRIVMTALAHRADDRYPNAASFGAQLRSYRYAVVSAAADPAVDISRMVEEMGGREPIDGSSAARKPTFVRISTVAGFSGGFELSEETTGDGFTGEQTQDRALDDRDDHGEHEDTHAVRLGDRARELARLDSELHLDEGDTRVATDPVGIAARGDRPADRPDQRDRHAGNHSAGNDRDRAERDHDRAERDHDRADRHHDHRDRDRRARRDRDRARRDRAQADRGNDSVRDRGRDRDRSREGGRDRDRDRRRGADVVDRATGDLVASSGEFDLSDAETSVLDYRRPRGLFESFGLDGDGDRDGRRGVVALPGVFQTITPSDGHPALDPSADPEAGLGISSIISSAPRSVSSPAPRNASASTAPPPVTTAASSPASLTIESTTPGRSDDRAPTIRRWLRTPWSSESESGRAAPVAHRAPPRAHTRRRRMLFIASGVAVVVATLTFVFAGTILGGDDTASADLADAAPPPDAAVTMTMPPEAVEPRPPRKKRKKPPARKKAGKTGKNAKSTKNTKSSKSDKR